MVLCGADIGYIDKIKGILRVDLDARDEVCPCGMVEILAVSKGYEDRIKEEVIERVVEDARWLVLYFMRCRHMARPIDKVLARNVIDTLGGFLSFGG